MRDDDDQSFTHTHALKHARSTDQTIICTHAPDTVNIPPSTSQLMSQRERAHKDTRGWRSRCSSSLSPCLSASPPASLSSVCFDCSSPSFSRLGPKELAHLSPRYRPACVRVSVFGGARVCRSQSSLSQSRNGMEKKEKKAWQK